MGSLPCTEERVETDPLILNVETVGLMQEQFFQLCSDNRELYLELTARKELVIMTLPGGKTGRRNTIIVTHLTNWADKSGTGPTVGPLTLSMLPNGALRAPDASWIRRERWDALTDEQQEKATPLCPDCVVELMSWSYRLQIVQSKMDEYMANGAHLGWLIDPYKKRVYVYRPNVPVDYLESPLIINGDPLLPGFVLPVSEIW